MKRFTIFLLIFTACFLSACNSPQKTTDILATTVPVYDFTSAICKGTDLNVQQLITENVSCLHDYTLKVDQMRMIESAECIVISGAGLEAFLDDALHSVSSMIDASAHTHLHESEHHHDDHGNAHHNHEIDAHIWLSPENATQMAQNICAGLIALYPQYETQFQNNLNLLQQDFVTLKQYGEDMLSTLSCKEMITFHDGFGYLAESFDLSILKAIEEEAGSETSAAEIIELIGLIQAHKLPAIFIETNGSDATATIISSEVNIPVYTLDMAMSSAHYFEAMYRNIDTIKEALG